MSMFGEAQFATDGACLQCNKCRRMFSIDCTNPALSTELLFGEVAASKAEALRRKIALKKSGDRNQEPFVAGPASTFGEVYAAPWLAGRREGDGDARCCPLSLSTMPLTLAPNIHLSATLGDRAKTQPLLRVDSSMLHDPHEAHAQDGESERITSPSSVPMHQALTKRDDAAAVRPRGGPKASSVTAADVAQCGPYLQRALLLHAAWDLLETVSEEALLNVPLCSSCWREVLDELRLRVDRDQSLVAASEAYLHPTADNYAMCAVGMDTPSHGRRGSTLPYGNLLEEDGICALRELTELDDVLHDLQNTLSALETEEQDVRKREEEAEAERNAAELLKECNSDDHETTHHAHQQILLELRCAEEQCALRELFVVELPAGCPTMAIINGVRIGRLADSAASTPAAAQKHSSAGASTLTHTFMAAAPPPLHSNRDGGALSSPRGGGSKRPGVHQRVFAVRDVARRTTGEAYFPFSGAGSISIAEINGACGYLAAALDAVVRRSGKGQLDVCVLRPNGLESMIDVPIPNKKPPRYDDLRFHIVEKLFAWKTFGQAWVAYTLGMRELIEFLQGKLSTRLGLELHDASSFAPYPIDKEGRVGGYSPKHGTVSDDVWGKAIRCALANLDWCLAAQTVLEEHALRVEAVSDEA